MGDKSRLDSPLFPGLYGNLPAELAISPRPWLIPAGRLDSELRRLNPPHIPVDAGAVALGAKFPANMPDQYPIAVSICCNSGPPASRLRMLAAISVTSWATVGRRATCGITVILGCSHSGLSGGRGSGDSASNAA